jgi:hypothetical protein
VSPSFGPLARVSCWSLLGLRSRDLHVPNSFLFSSHRYFRVWILLRFNLSSNNVAVHRFVRPQLVSLIIHPCSCLCSSIRRQGLALFLLVFFILPCSCLCSSIRMQGLAFLARLTKHRRFDNQRRRCAAIAGFGTCCSEAGSNYVATPPNQELSEPFRILGTLVYISTGTRFNVGPFESTE